MTYCVGIALNAGLVFASDSRTNAGSDQVSQYGKMHTMGIEGERQFVLLSAGNLAFIAFAKYSSSLGGQIIVFFIITVAACEAAIGLAIILLVFRQKKTIKAEDLNLMKG